MRRLLRAAVPAATALLLLVPPAPAAAQDAVDRQPVTEQRIDGAGVSLDTTLYLPGTTPAPAVLLAHGFGGDKTSVDAEARDLVARGFAVLAWSARGFGTSTGEIALNAPEAEVTDARALLDWLAARPEVALDAPGDPRVGATGASYGGALALLLAGTDPRVDAIAPVITWNDLGQALFPQAAGPVPAATPAAAPFGADGVFKRGWAGVFFSAGLEPGTTCGRFAADVCAAYTEAATTGRLSPATAARLARSSPASVTGSITAPTLLVQGEQDTLFGLDQADANARQIAAAGTPVQVRWYAGGHDGAPPGPAVRDAVGDELDRHLGGTGPEPDGAFAYAVESGIRAGSSTPTGRTVVAPAYPGLAPGTATGALDLPLEGPPQPVLRPAGGNPAAITSLPGVGGALGTVGGRLTVSRPTCPASPPASPPPRSTPRSPGPGRRG